MYRAVKEHKSSISRLIKFYEVENDARENLFPVNQVVVCV